ncbi:MAG: hypothetical protein C5B50_19255 [Verrucomicrobia bacterium]|nr:MAG: hypothetical protein C5B50_19255 [Verrucomicrobiota bacterium]
MFLTLGCGRFSFALACARALWQGSRQAQAAKAALRASGEAGKGLKRMSLAGQGGGKDSFYGLHAAQV